MFSSQVSEFVTIRKKLTLKIAQVFILIATVRLVDSICRILSENNILHIAEGALPANLSGL